MPPSKQPSTPVNSSNGEGGTYPTDYPTHSNNTSTTNVTADENGFAKTFTPTSQPLSLANQQSDAMLLEGDGDEPSDCLMDTSPVTVRELRGWKIFGFATEGYSALAISVFFPIILEHLASSQGFETSSTKPGQGPLLPCNISATSYSCSISINNSWVDTTSFVFYATTISVFIQFLLFINLGALADHGGNRKNFLVGFAVTTSLLAICTLFVTSNTTSHTVLHMSFFMPGSPLLTRYHPQVIAAHEDGLPYEEYYHVYDKVANLVSSQGFLWGYFSAVIQLIIGAGIFIVMGSGAHYSLPDVYPLQIGIAVSGVWTLVFLPFTYSWLKPRPGSPLPAGENVFLFSIKKLGRTLCKVRQLGQLFIFLFAWFIYSDGFTTIIAVAILFFRTDLGVDTTSLLIAAIIAPLFAGIGCFVWNEIQLYFKLSTKVILMIQAFMYCVLCSYGILGFFTKPGTFGLRSGVEIFPLAAYHGFLLGATQSSCRVLFSELLPPGYESEFFSLYEITDKGSAWVGPLIVGLIDDKTHNKRNSFFFLLTMLVLPIFIFGCIDLEKGKKQAREYVEQERSYAKKRTNE
ncbi:hypothetical protein BSLG_001639 [Batrachochytrium salamandrivorans]|nr:hypothetical protein BSLG_001639 [Batrachochytrium salamandrivorans]